ncbi:unnamed protein product [Closterium sp. NIES-54]
MGLVLGGRGPVVLTGHADASWIDDSATQRSSQGYTFSLGSGSVSWRSTRSSSVLSSSCEAEIYAGAMAAQELRWLTYLLTDLGEQPRSPPILYVDNKAMIALYQEHRLEHRTKHIALQYFLAQELQQRGQLRLAYVATRANTADIFTKALPPDYKGKVESFSEFIRQMRMVHRFPLNLIVHADQTPLWLEMPAERTLEMKGARTVHVRTAGYEKERVTVMLAVTADSLKLPPYVIFKRKTVPRIVVPPGEPDVLLSLIPCVDNGWMDGRLVQDWTTQVLVPFLKPLRDEGGRRNQALLVFDSYKGHLTESVGQTLKMFKCGVRHRYGTWFLEVGIGQTTCAKELVKKSFLTCGISNAEDESEDHLILAHLRDKAEVEVLEEEEGGAHPNPFYKDPSHTPEPPATKDDEAEDEEEGLAGEEDVVDAAAEEGDGMAPDEEGGEADAEMGGADEWSKDGDN